MPGRRTADQVRKMADPALDYNYTMTFADIPGNGGLNLENFSVRILQTEIPEINNEPIEIVLNGITKHYAGRRVWSHILTTEILELHNFDTFNVLMNWAELTFDESSRGVLKKDYVTRIYVDNWDQTGQRVNSIVFHDCFIETLGPIQLSSDGADAIRIPVTFSFFYFERENRRSNPNFGAGSSNVVDVTALTRNPRGLRYRRYTPPELSEDVVNYRLGYGPENGRGGAGPNPNRPLDYGPQNSRTGGVPGWFRNWERDGTSPPSSVLVDRGSFNQNARNAGWRVRRPGQNFGRSL